ncbi:sensor histidine kinase [Siphonobacter sp. SORGH_AS_1065]|uniref:sensor histidine kinase n=1 Tax=Siphonobacter sp. SORGH_AS_1065 TaxID=3041795 RepID=UPI0027817F3E|nr:histidine kinase [Siphonobacter sp. SORGH_AS_1065]MDQ1090007.1 two-component system LytT family sensor kinase [Siphonobacter sp. SORGH_AS_1065]
MKIKQKPFRKPTRSDWILIGILWLIAFPFMVVGNWERPWWFILIGWLVNVATHTGPVLVMVYVLFPVFLVTRRYGLLFLSMLIVLLIFGLFDQLFIWQWYHANQPFQWFSVLYSFVSVSTQAGVLAAVLTAKHFYETQQRLIRIEKERTEAELRHLKAQIDPHFLFNNLNVLGALIERNPKEASAYLHRFSALYRYLIRHRDDDVITLADELAFLNDYVYLIRQRFGRAYEILTTVQIPDTLVVLVLPGSLQSLVENAVKHNRSSEGDPLLIELIVNDETIVVRNERRPKLTPIESTGTGLQNLQARYALLSDKTVLVKATPTEFVVTLPLLRPVVAELNNPFTVTPLLP